MLSIIETERLSVLCRGILVEMDNSVVHDFVNPEEVRKTIMDKGVKTRGAVLENINILRLEKTINQNPSIERADVYRQINGTLCVSVKQRNPIVRIITCSNDGYYIDEKGAMMPLSDRYTARVPVANGNIRQSYVANYTRNVLKLVAKDTTQRVVIKDIYTLSQYIHNNEFLSALIEQIYINDDKTFALVPKIGSSTIQIGTVENLDEKFKKLWIMYKRALPLTGWENYASIDVQYKNQVVCTKK